MRVFKKFYILGNLIFLICCSRYSEQEKLSPSKVDTFIDTIYVGDPFVSNPNLKSTVELNISNESDTLYFDRIDSLILKININGMKVDSVFFSDNRVNYQYDVRTSTLTVYSPEVGVMFKTDVYGFNNNYKHVIIESNSMMEIDTSVIHKGIWVGKPIFLKR